MNCKAFRRISKFQVFQHFSFYRHLNNLNGKQFNSGVISKFCRGSEILNPPYRQGGLKVVKRKTLYYFGTPIQTVQATQMNPYSLISLNYATNISILYYTKIPAYVLNTLHIIMANIVISFSKHYCEVMMTNVVACWAKVVIYDNLQKNYFAVHVTAALTVERITRQPIAKH
ncbi:hypothetical protein AGLY_005687 [Aphis glycines]|uniref:Uncharacterized protein n=1 Tax=Aphis glycines TaxID=307491 RepID=A0A6G0TTX6_APHGL|nr:hypothetical protein AGLY_005687 [Aphis glycines]